MKRLTLLLQRLLIFLLGVLTVWLIAFVFFDFADRWLPWVIALAVTYGLAAYVILPRAIRLGLMIQQRRRVPSYTTTADGLPGDPVNLALIGTMPELRRAFETIGWSAADPLGLTSSWRMVGAFVLNRPYPRAPFSTLYLFGRGQDVGFQQPIGDSPRRRNHVRFWGLPLERAEQTIDTPLFWLDALRPADDERAVWLGAGTKDIGFSLTWLSFQITHATDVDTNKERDFIVEQLQHQGVIANVRSHLPGERLSIGHVNRYVSDGIVVVAELQSK